MQRKNSVQGGLGRGGLTPAGGFANHKPVERFLHHRPIIMQWDLQSVEKLPFSMFA